MFFVSLSLCGDELDSTMRGGHTTGGVSHVRVYEVEEGDSVSLSRCVFWTQLVPEVWEGFWKYELCREGVQVDPHKFEE